MGPPAGNTVIRDVGWKPSRVEGPALPFGKALHHPVGNRADCLLRDLGAVDLSQVRGDLPVRQPFRRQGNHHLVDPGEPPLPFSDDFRLEAGIAVPRHADFHRPGIGEHRLGAVPIAGIAAVAACRVVLAIAEVVIELALQGALDHHLGQPPQQAALAGQLQAAGPGPLGQFPQQLLISRRQPRPALIQVSCHICHWCLPTCQELHR
jgi:hypothetical protein